MGKLEELKKELKESEAELDDTKSMIKEYDKKITSLSYGKTCMEEKLVLVNEKIDALKAQIECLFAKPRVFKCKEESNPYGATKGTYAIYRNGRFEYKKCLQLKSEACQMLYHFVPSGFEEITDLFDRLDKGSVVFIVSPEKAKEFFTVLYGVFDKPCKNTDALDKNNTFMVYKNMDPENPNYSTIMGSLADIGILSMGILYYKGVFENAKYVVF